jgi:hypothetical protein
MRTIAGKLKVGALSLALLAPQLGLAQQVDEDPSALAMVGDAVVARPLGLLFTVVGAATYVVTLPFSLAGGNAKEAGETLVVGPAMSTFVRCLGCTRTGYQRDARYAEADTYVE